MSHCTSASDINGALFPSSLPCLTVHPGGLAMRRAMDGRSRYGELHGFLQRILHYVLWTRQIIGTQRFMKKLFLVQRDLNRAHRWAFTKNRSVNIRTLSRIAVNKRSERLFLAAFEKKPLLARRIADFHSCV